MEANSVTSYFMPADNHSAPLPWVSEYLQCSVLLSSALNITLSYKSWFALIHFFGNDSALEIEDSARNNSSFSPFEKCKFRDVNETIFATGKRSTMCNLTDTLLKTNNFTNRRSRPDFGILPYVINSIYDINPTVNTTILGVLSDEHISELNNIHHLNTFPHPATTTSFPSASSGASNYSLDPSTITRSVAQWCLGEVLHQKRPFLMAWWQQGLWTLVFGLMLTVAISGNVLVMWIVSGKMLQQSVATSSSYNSSAVRGYSNQWQRPRHVTRQQ